MDRALTGHDGPEIKIFLEYVVYLFFRLLEEAFCLMPSHEKALSVGQFIGRVIFVCARERRLATLENLDLAFGNEISASQRRLLARKNFEHLGMLPIEFFRIRRWTQADIAERLEISGKQSFDVAWAPGENGIYYIAAHYGSFEVLAAVSKFLGLKGHLVVTGAPNRFVNERMLFRRGGDETGLNILPHTGIVRSVIEKLLAGSMVVVLADQRGDDTRPIWVNFFGRKVLANGVFAKFAVEGRVQTFPVVATRLPGGRYRCVFEEEIPIQVSDDSQNDLEVNSQRFHNVFERWLREDPSQGFWMHRKFKRKSKRKGAKNKSPEQ